MKKILFVVLLLVCSLAFAQQSQTAKITGYIPYDLDGKELLFVQLEGNRSGGCNVTARYAIDSSQLKFKGTRAALIAAFHTQTPVTIFYNETCNAYSNSWDIAWVCVGTIPC
jgi:hypothetical protein